MFLSEERRKEHIKDIFNTKPNMIKHVEKIILPDKMIPLDVEMDDYYVVMCEDNEEIFLFTSGLGPCIAVTAIAEVGKNRIALGIAHLLSCLSILDFPSLSSEERSRMIGQGYNRVALEPDALNKMVDAFHPYKFNKLIDTIKHNHVNNSIIDIYLGGGRGYDPVPHQLYCEYIKSHTDLRLCDIALDPYKITSHDTSGHFSEKVMSTLSTTFGVTSKKEVIVAKRVNIEDISKFDNDYDLAKYCETRQIIFPPDEELVYGFEKLTWEQLWKDGSEYIYDEMTKTISRKPSAMMYSQSN